MDFTEAYPERCSTVGVAAKAGKAEVLRELISSGASVRISDNRGWFPQHEAAAAGHIDCLKILLNHEDTDFDWKTHDGKTALYLAADSGHTDALQLLLKTGANPVLGNDDNAEPLYAAANNSNEKCVESLLEYKANVNCVYFNGWTPLHAAAFRGHLGIMKKLLKAGGSVSAMDDYKITSTFVAAQYGHSECLKMLIEAGGDPNTQAKDGVTALYIATQEGHLECVKYLIESGADPNLHTVEGSKPVFIAAEKQDLYEILKILLPVSELEYIPGTRRWSPLHCTTVNNNIEAAKLILDYGVDVNTGYTHSNKELTVNYDPDILSPLCHSYDPKNMELFRLLISRGAVIRCEGVHFDGCYMTEILRDSIFDEKYDINAMQELLDYGLKIDCKCHIKFPYHLLINSNVQLQLYKFLLESGFEPKLNCVYKCRCNESISFIRCISLAVHYVPGDCICPGSLKYLKDSAYWPHIRKFIDIPAPLQHLCRLAVREILRPKGLHRMKEFVSNMDITNVTKSYLLYEDYSTDMILKEEQPRVNGKD